MVKKIIIIRQGERDREIKRRIKNDLGDVSYKNLLSKIEN